MTIRKYCGENLFLLASNGINRSTNIDAVILMLLKEPISITKTVNCASVTNKLINIINIVENITLWQHYLG